MSAAADATAPPVPRLSLRVAYGRAAQQALIDDWAAHAAVPRAVLVEAGLQALDAPPDTVLERLPAGCVCCVANVPLRVALVRVLRRVRPAQVLLVIASDSHLDQVRHLLAAPPLGDAFTLETA